MNHMHDKDLISHSDFQVNGTIPLASINNGTKRLILFGFISLLVLYTTACVYFCGRSMISIFLFAIGVFLVVRFGKTYRTLSSAVIKGDAVILKNLQNEHAVTHVRSIRTIQTKRLAGKRFTSLRYHLDGTQRKALLVTDLDQNDSPQLMIRRIQRELKKKKANL